MTFNTKSNRSKESSRAKSVLNLIINGWPSIPGLMVVFELRILWVLNLIINGWPSIPYLHTGKREFLEVLNLIINGWPSIHIKNFYKK